STGIATVKYTVTNNSSKAHNLVIVPQRGVSQNRHCALAPKGSCSLILTITGSALLPSGFSGGPVLCQADIDGKTPSPFLCYSPNIGDNLAIKVVPHHLSMLPIANQEATADQSFVFNLKSAVQFYDENLKAGFPAQGLVTPAQQDGLRFDPGSFSIVGTPQRTGTYQFKVAAKNINGTAAAVDFKVQVQVNAKEKPIFKQHYAIASALPEQKYSMNLMELVEEHTGFMVTNQISFRIDPRFNHPGWLNISNGNATLLLGEVPKIAAGQEVEVTLIAASNTGGDSQPLTIKIPIAVDPTRKPVLKPFGLEKSVGTHIYEHLSAYINDPGQDSNLQVILEKVEPAAPWLSISSLNPTVLEGNVPDKAIGPKYLLTLRANTSIGGSSEPVIIPLQITIKKERTPRFKAANPLIPMIYPGQSFIYDFVANKDIYPEYSDAPYEIKFAEGFNPPPWLRLENNRLIADLVP
ncbi:MAG: putative Ig domain-containing protein, partial [bacterium]|nr:putative Ig domain-containing protein [bacterium]